MNRPRDELFARSGLANDQNARVGRGYRRYDGEHFLQPLRLTDDTRCTLGWIELALQRHVAVYQALVTQRPHDRRDQGVFRVHGLDQIVVRALPHYFHRGGDIACTDTL